jgi:alkylated DNA repair dioxygenase AlkB
MDLFGHDPAANLLPCDGIVRCFGAVLNETEAEKCFTSLRDSTPWRHDEVVIFGKRIVTAREVAWYADDGISYRYSGTTKPGLAWTPELLTLKSLAESLTGHTYNSCLLNHYHDGSEGMGWHSDDEKSIVGDSAIASISLGAAREFRLKHKRTDERVSIQLDPGTLLLMAGSTQRHWLHSIPKTQKVHAPRINLTFRSVYPRTL